MTPARPPAPAPAPARAPRRAAGGDDGSVTLLVIGLVVVLCGLLATVTAVSQVVLARRALLAATDEAALRGAQAADLDVLYRDGAAGRGDPLPLDRAAVRDAVAGYVDLAGLADRFEDFAVVSVRVDDGTVRVRTRATVRFALVGAATGGRSDVEVTAESAARTRLR